MRRIRYQVACSLDGYLSGPDGEIDWIPMDPEIDFQELFSQFDTLLMGRRTYEELPLDAPEYQGKRIVVFSRTLRQEDHPGVEIIAGQWSNDWMNSVRNRVRIFGYSVVESYSAAYLILVMLTLSNQP